MPFGDYDSMSDCISKNTGKVDDPGAYCASIHYKATGKWPSQETRHPDFQKIYTQFLTKVPNELEAQSRYFGWIHEHDLDERKYYGYVREKVIIGFNAM